MNYQGNAFCDSLPKGRTSGTILLSSKKLTFEYDGGFTELELNSTSIKAGGSGDQLLFFVDRNKTDWRIYTRDWSILKNKALEYHPSVKEVYAKRSRERIKTSVWLLITLFILVLIGGSIWYAVTDLADLAAAKVPRSWEKEAGDKLFPLVVKEKKLIEDEEISKKLKELIDPLLKSVDEEELEFSVHLLEDSEINAFAMPGGYVVINSGLLLKAKTKDQVLGVLAHELAHVIKRHHTRSILKNAGIYLTIQVFLGDVTALSVNLLEWSVLLSQMKTSRSFEYEADKTGWDLLLNAKINPRGMIEFFEILNEELGDMKIVEETFSILSTHPATQDRLNRLEKMWEGCQTKNNFIESDFDFMAFQNLLMERLEIKEKKDRQK